MTMIYGLSREDNLVMLIENIIYDNGYLKRATKGNKLELLESLIVAREQVLRDEIDKIIAEIEG